MGDIYGYCCLSSTKIPASDTDRRKKTKAYIEIQDVFRRLDLPVEKIYLDCIRTLYRKRKNFEHILQNCGNGDCVVIASVSALGPRPDEIEENYLALYRKNIGLYVDTKSEKDEDVRAMADSLSTSDGIGPIRKELVYSGGPLPDEIEEKLDVIRRFPVKWKNGAAKKGRPEHFKEVYWLYENYFLKESDTYHNNLVDLGKKRFYALATEYEREDPDYESDLEEQEMRYHITGKPKRHGVVPEGFDRFLELIDSGKSAEEACHIMDYPRIVELDIPRYRLKHEGGRQIVLMTASQTRKSALAEELTKGVVNSEKSGEA